MNNNNGLANRYTKTALENCENWKEYQIEIVMHSYIDVHMALLGTKSDKQNTCRFILILSKK